MKNLLLKSLFVVVLLAIGAGIGYAAVAHYTNTQKTKPAPVEVVPVAEVERQFKEMAAKDDARYKELTSRLDRQTAECQKGAAAYAKLTPYNKTQTEQPQCLESTPSAQ